VILLACAVAAAGSGAVAIIEVLAATGDAASDAWRAFGLLVFSGLFVALALRPLGNRLLWGLVIGHKVAVAAHAAAVLAGGGATDEARRDLMVVLLVDGLIAGLLVVAFWACRGWRPDRPALSS